MLLFDASIYYQPFYGKISLCLRHMQVFCSHCHYYPQQNTVVHQDIGKDLPNHQLQLHFLQFYFDLYWWIHQICVLNVFIRNIYIFDAILHCIQKLNYHNNSCKLSKISFFQERSYYLKHLDKWLANVHNTSFPHYNLFHNYHNPCIYNPNKYNHRGCQDL